MRYIKSGAYLLIFSVLVSCNNKAVDYNNELVKIQKSLVPEVQAFAKKMELTSTGTISLKDLENDSKKIVALLDKKMAEAAALPVAKGGEELKNAIMDQLKFERDICYKTGKLGNDNTSEEEKSIITQEFMNSETDAQKFEEKVAEAQKRFAEKNNFTIGRKIISSHSF